MAELLKNDFNPVIFFYNPNIHPKEEYEKRKSSAKKLAEIYDLEFIEEDYNPQEWLEKVKGLEKEPEGGARCPVCFEMRLLKTALIAYEKNIDIFTTTLAVSPYKNELTINEVGKKIAEDFSLRFLKSSELNLSKKDIWQKSREFARRYDFYHQKYCGCTFSNPNK